MELADLEFKHVEYVGSINIDIDEEDRKDLGRRVHEEYVLDDRSMSVWKDRMRRGIDLATMVKAEKTYPWPDASNVRYPLITSAALQFNARAYPAIVPADSPVKTKVFGEDPQGVKAERGERVKSFMNWQLTSQIPEWEPETDSLLTMLPIVGTMVRKVWFDPGRDRPRIKLCDAGKVIINNRVKTIRDAPRVSEELMLYPYEVEERIRSGVFREFDLEQSGTDDPDEAQKFIEQHRREDLDGDGYAEPYIVTIYERTQEVVRIVANYELSDIKKDESRVTSVTPRDYYIPYHFLPSMDGGFWGTGLGVLLGDISESINSLINMMLDAGHLASLGGGFVGAQNFRVKGTSVRLKPAEWKQVPAAGDDIRKGIVQMNFPGPDAVLFQMLGLLLEAGKEIASIKDVMTGDAGRANQPATTTLALIEQGMMVFTAAYKRIYRSLRAEFKMLCEINAENVAPGVYAAFHDIRDGEAAANPQADFSLADMDISPVADPQSVTSMQSLGRAQFLLELADAGKVEQGPAIRRVLEAAHIEDVDELLPEPDPQQQQMQMKLAADDIEHHRFMQQIEREEGAARIQKLLAEAKDKEMEALKAAAEIEQGAEKIELQRIAEQSKDRRERMTALLKAMNDADKRHAEGASRGPGVGTGNGNGSAPVGGAKTNRPGADLDIRRLVGSQPAGNSPAA